VIYCRPELQPIRDHLPRLRQQQALPKLRRALALRRLGDLEAATQALVEASAAWTHATWKEFLEQGVIGAKQPDAYRPLASEG